MKMYHRSIFYNKATLLAEESSKVKIYFDFLTELFKDENASATVSRGSDLKVVCMSPVEAQDSDRTKWVKDGKTMDPEVFPRYVFSRLM